MISLVSPHPSCWCRPDTPAVSRCLFWLPICLFHPTGSDRVRRAWPYLRGSPLVDIPFCPGRNITPPLVHSTTPSGRRRLPAQPIITSARASDSAHGPSTPARSLWFYLTGTICLLNPSPLVTRRWLACRSSPAVATTGPNDHLITSLVNSSPVGMDLFSAFTPYS